MTLGCGANLAKCFLVYFNGFFWLMGAVLLTFGVAFRSEPSLVNLSELIAANQPQSVFQVLAYALLGTGTVLFAVSLLGCCGAVRENKICLSVYAIKICIIMIVQGVGAHFFIESLPALIDDLEISLLSVVKNYETATQIGKALDYVQLKFSCCGESGPKDYYLSKFYNTTNGVIPTPYSCCKVVEPDLLTFCDQCDKPVYVNDTICKQHVNRTGESDYINTNGCGAVLLKFLEEYQPLIIGLGAGFLAVQFFGVIFSVFLCNAKHVVHEDKSEIVLPVLTRRKTKAGTDAPSPTSPSLDAKQSPGEMPPEQSSSMSPVQSTAISQMQSPPLVEADELEESSQPTDTAGTLDETAESTV